MGRTHVIWCETCSSWWSPFDFNRCPVCAAQETDGKEGAE